LDGKKKFNVSVFFVAILNLVHGEFNERCYDCGRWAPKEEHPENNRE
jgi:hypothetical protein